MVASEKLMQIVSALRKYEAEGRPLRAFTIAVVYGDEVFRGVAVDKDATLDDVARTYFATAKALRKLEDVMNGYEEDAESETEEGEK